jgi:hypothetical protein
VVLALAAPARAEPAVGLTSTDALATFDTANPSQLSVRPIGSLQSATEHVVGIDWRPRTNQVFITTVPVGVAANALVRTYSVDVDTGQATFVGSIPNIVPGAADVPSGYDFNPTVDRIRFVNVNDENFRINPNNGSLAADDPNLNPAGQQIVAEAYDRNFDRTTASPPTTLYGISRATNSLVTQGGIDGSAPGGANGGTIATVGALGVMLAAGSDAGLDISPNTNTAFAALRPTGQAVSRLYTVNLTTGAATEVGRFPVDVVDLAILPTPPPPSGGGAATVTLTNTVTVPALTPQFGPDITKPIVLIALPASAHLKRRLTIEFSCSEACTASARLTAGKATIATGTATLRAAGVGKLVLTARKAARNKLRRGRAVRSKLSATFTDPAGNATVITRSLAVQR